MMVGLVGSNGKVTEVFNTSQEAADAFGVSKATIIRSVRYGKLVHKRYSFVEVHKKEA